MTSSSSHNIVWEFPDDGPNAKTCHKCGESNPGEAVMCSLCYIPLYESERADEIQEQCHEHQRQENWRRRRELWSSMLFDALLPGSLLTVCLSGYFPKYRLDLLALAAFCLLVSWCWSRHNKALHAQHANLEQEGIQRITDTILLFAVRDGATKVVLRAGVMGIECEYLIGDKWEEQMRLPSYLWSPIREHLSTRSGNWDYPFSLELEGTNGRFLARLEHLFPHQTIVLMREN